MSVLVKASTRVICEGFTGCKRILPSGPAMAFALTLALPAPAAAQTLDEAVRANIALALALCLSTPPDPAMQHAAFIRSGFTYQPEDFGGGDIAHWFQAPADTVTVLARAEGRDAFCAVSTQHMGVTAAVPFAGEALNRLYPGRFTYGGMEGGPPRTPQDAGSGWGECTGYVGWNGQRPIVVSIGNAGQDPNCAEDGTSQIMVAM